MRAGPWCRQHQQALDPLCGEGLLWGGAVGPEPDHDPGGRGGVWKVGTGACLCLISEVTSWDLPVHPTPRRLQYRGAPEGHSASAGPGAPCQQATPRLLQPSV